MQHDRADTASLAGLPGWPVCCISSPIRRTDVLTPSGQVARLIHVYVMAMEMGDGDGDLLGALISCKSAGPR